MTQDEGWCPNGSQQITPVPGACAVSIDLAAAAALAVIFPLGIPGEIAALISGVSWGTIAASALCSMPPIDPGPFPGAALLTTFLDAEAQLLQWVANSLQRYWWMNCCACKPPPTPPGVKIADWSFTNWVGGNLMVQPFNPAFGYGSIIFVKGNVTNVEAAGTGYWQALAGHYTPTVQHTCPNGTAFSNQIQQAAWGPGSAAYAPHSHGNYGQDVTSVDMYTTISSQDCIGIAVGKQGTTAAHINGHIELWQQITDPLTYPPETNPPTLQPTGPSGGGSSSPIYGAPTEGIVPCVWGPIAANWIERSLAPRSRVADGGVVHISGTGSILIPAGAVGWTVVITAYPPGHSHDAGDPPQLYQVGWMAPSIDGVEMAGKPQNITSGQEQFWSVRPTEKYVVYNLFPGFTANVQFWSTSTPN